MEIAVYAEGGGSPEQRADLRRGLEALLADQKEGARARGIGWKMVCCGPRDAAFGRFRAARAASPQAIHVLLVDSEGPLRPGEGAKDYLQGREPHWPLDEVQPERVHLMVQCMETWIIADPERVAGYFGQRFQANALPARPDLEEEPKQSVQQSLEHSSRQTQKGKYQKGRDSSKLLLAIRAHCVRARCPHFGQLADWLDQVVALA